MRGPTLLLVLTLVLAAPLASAFRVEPAPLALEYAQDASPVVVAAGRLSLTGSLHGGLALGEAEGARLLAIPSLRVVERHADGGASERTYSSVTLMVHEGALLATFEGGRFDLDAQAPYGVALAMPSAPLPRMRGAGFLLASEALTATGAWSGAGALALVPIDAGVSILDARGQPVDGWNRRTVNAGAVAREGDQATFDVLMEARGGFTATLPAALLAGAVGEGADVALTAAPSGDDRFAATLDLLARVGARTLGSAAGGPLHQGGALRTVEQASPVLDGALLIVPDGQGGAPDARPLVATYRGEPVEVAPMALVRGGELGVLWREGHVRVQGEPDVVLGPKGFAVPEPRTLWGLVPLLSAALWAAALVALAVFVVRRPPREKVAFPLRALAWAAHVAVLLVALAWWDQSFAQTFGASVLTQVREGPVGLGDVPRLGVLFTLQMLPWGIAALAFALPVRIVAGVALRVVAKGKGLDGFASALGLVALALVGPVYALWLVNVVIGLAAGP